MIPRSGRIFFEKMNISEIITLEATNADKIYLLKEGFFWRAYERSAYRFVKHIRNFQAVKRHVKKVKMEVCFIGFPENLLSAVLDDCNSNNTIKIIDKSNKQLVIVTQNTEDNFEQWKEQIKILLQKQGEAILEKIKKYPVSVKTPIETVQFVAELQSQMFNE